MEHALLPICYCVMETILLFAIVEATFHNLLRDNAHQRHCENTNMHLGNCSAGRTEIARGAGCRSPTSTTTSYMRSAQFFGVAKERACFVDFPEGYYGHGLHSAPGGKVF
jgi:hypothetical protein